MIWGWGGGGEEREREGGRERAHTKKVSSLKNAKPGTKTKLAHAHLAAVVVEQADKAIHLLVAHDAANLRPGVLTVQLLAVVLAALD